MQDKLVSVIINCFNAEQYIEKAIDSVLSQTYEHFELIVWDNFSSDSTRKKIDFYDDIRIKKYYSDVHTNLSIARNAAFNVSGGRYICYLDADDWWHPRKIEEQIAVIRSGEYGFVCSNFYLVNEYDDSYKLKYNYTNNFTLDTNSLLKYYNVGFLTLMVDRNSLESTEKPFDERFHLIGDFDYCLNVSKYARGYFINKPLAYNLWHARSLSVTKHQLGQNELFDWAITSGIEYKEKYQKNASCLINLIMINNLKYSLKSWNYISYRFLWSSLRYKIVNFLNRFYLNYVSIIFSKIYYKLVTQHEFIYFINQKLTLDFFQSSIINENYSIEIIDLNKCNNIIKDTIIRFFINSSLFNVKDFQVGYDPYCLLVKTKENQKILHCTLFYKNANESPLVKTPLPNSLINSNIAYLGTAYTDENFRGRSLSPIVLNEIFKYLKNNTSCKSAINLVHLSTKNAREYFEALGFTKIYSVDQMPFFAKIIKKLIQYLYK